MGGDDDRALDAHGGDDSWPWCRRRRRNSSIDNVLGGKPLPASVPAWVPREPWPLLVALAMVVLGLSLVKMVIQMWGRWHATRVTKLVQLSVRKQVFAHVMRLPLHRVQELKSGGAASILRQDAGSVGDLVFGMLYNPWRAVIQLVGSLFMLAWVDWRLLLGALATVPLVFLSHRTWISRIRPQHRRIRAEREKIDSQATEAFGGMRVVRAFGRQRSETNRIARGNHLMGRQELHAWWWMRGIEIVWEMLMPLASAALLDLRRLAGAGRPAVGGRPDDVPGLPGDAAGAAGRAGAECGGVSEQPVGARPRARPAGRAAGDGGGRGGEGRSGGRRRVA